MADNFPHGHIVNFNVCSRMFLSRSILQIRLLSTLYFFMRVPGLCFQLFSLMWCTSCPNACNITILNFLYHYLSPRIPKLSYWTFLETSHCRLSFFIMISLNTFYQEFYHLDPTTPLNALISKLSNQTRDYIASVVSSLRTNQNK